MAASFTAGTLLKLLVHPASVIRTRAVVRPLWLLLAVAGLGLITGLAFSHLYPRLLNTIPWLGFLRKFNPGTWDPGFDPELFLRGAGMGLALYGSYFLIYVLLGWVGTCRRTVADHAVHALSTCIPLVFGCAAGFLLFYLHRSLGLLPVYGLLAAFALHLVFLRDLFRIPRLLIVYLAPALLMGQLYLCSLWMP
jgi:hypothetical protein